MPVFVHRAQEVFRDALQTDEIRLRIHRPTPRRSTSSSSMQDSSGPTSPRAHSLFKSVPPPPPQRSPSTALSTQSSTSSLPRQGPLSPAQPITQTNPTDSQAESLMQSTTRKPGKKIHIELTKGIVTFGLFVASFVARSLHELVFKYIT